MFDRSNFWSQYSLLLRVSFISKYFGFQVSMWFFIIESFISRASFFSYYIGLWCFVCTLSLSHIREVKCCGKDTVINHMRFLQGTSQSMMFPFIITISFVNLNQSAEDSCRFVPILNKIPF